MKGSTLLAAGVVAGLATCSASAQPGSPPGPARPVPVRSSPLVRADLIGSVSWLNVDATDANPYDDWYNRGLYGAVAAGWYWTDHLKTELEVGTTTTAEVYGARQVQVDHDVGYGGAERTFGTTRVSLAQQYQFFQNAWFHPFVAAGAAVVRETASARYDPVFLFDPVTRESRIALPGSTVGPETRVDVRPFADVGFKAYFTPRVFFRSDLRVIVAAGVDEVMVRFGIGVDVPR